MLVGPTAGGKSVLAVELALRLGAAEIVSADSMQVYRGLDIGTAKPPWADRRGVPHHLLDVADPHEGEFTLAQWLREARQVIDRIHSKGSVAIVVGGTNLYVRALLEGLAEAPATNPALRAELEAMPTEALRAELERADAATADRIHPRDRRRTLRALELHRLTGRRPSEVRNQWKDEPNDLPPGVALVGLEWEVPEINRRINDRVRGMLRAGLVDEVAALLKRGRLTRQADAAIGYREIRQHLEGVRSLEEAVEQIKIRSRRLGKQQRTWLRRFRMIPGSIWLPGDLGAAALADRVLQEIQLRMVMGRRQDSS